MVNSRPQIVIARPRDQYRYIMKPLPADTDAPRCCELCDKGGPDLYHQVEQRRYTKEPMVEGWTQEDNLESIGHQACLASLRRFTTNNTEYRTGLTVKNSKGKRFTIEKVGLTMTLDEALIREVTPSLIGHKPIEQWYPLADLKHAY